MRIEDLHDSLRADAAWAETMARKVAKLCNVAEELSCDGAECSADVDEDDGETLVTLVLNIGKRRLHAQRPLAPVQPETAIGSTVAPLVEPSAPAVADQAPSVAKPAPEVAPKPAPVAETPKADRPGPGRKKTGPLTDDERAEVLRLSDEGWTPSGIAERLNRQATGFHLVVKNLLAAREDAEKAAASKSVEPKVDTPKARAAATAPNVDASELPAASHGGDADLPAAAQAVLDRVNAEMNGFSNADWKLVQRLRLLKRPGGWTMADDLDLVERLTAGQKLAEIAADMATDAEWLKGQFRLLCPASSHEEQARVIKVLRVMSRPAEVAAE